MVPVKKRNDLKWNLKKVKLQLDKAFKDNPELELLKVLKENSFLFYELYSRKWGIQPNFKEVDLGGEYRCDFVWLNDNSDGPEWALVEIERPRMKLFTAKGEPSKELNHAIEQVKSWDRYFEKNPAEKKRIFGAVAKFRYILVAGDIHDWETEEAIRWRSYHNSKSKFEIRGSNVFHKALRVAEEKPEELWSFEESPVSLRNSSLKAYWENEGYMDKFRKIL